MVKGRLLLKDAWTTSVTVNCGLKLPKTVGMPPNAPVVGSMFIPLGSAVADQMYPPAPPLAVNVTGPYGRPCVPADSDAGPVIFN
jgi:hypothetical protein